EREMRVVMCCFFFSSRRRHTRLQGDWSSDVCSSDLQDRRAVEVEDDVGDRACTVVEALDLAEAEDFGDPLGRAARVFVREHRDRSEERRVGKECRSRWWP